MIGVDFGGGIWSIEEATAATAFIGNSGFSGLNALTANSAGVLFAAGSSQLVTINSTTGAGTLRSIIDLAGDAVSIRGLAFSPTGVLYAVNDAIPPLTDDDHDLWIIDVATGFGTLVGTLGTTVQGLDFAPDGTLYGYENRGHGLSRIDVLTAAVTDVDPSVPGSGIQSILFVGDRLYGVDSTLYSLDATTGAAQPIGVVGPSNSFIRGLEFVPEPSAIVLAMFVLVHVLMRRNASACAASK